MLTRCTNVTLPQSLTTATHASSGRRLSVSIGALHAWVSGLIASSA